jgi:hypothetical protein
MKKRILVIALCAAIMLGMMFIPVASYKGKTCGLKGDARRDMILGETISQVQQLDRYGLARGCEQLPVYRQYIL